MEYAIGFAGSLNLYSYANANPVNFVDPSGLHIWDGAYPISGGEGSYTNALDSMNDWALRVTPTPSLNFRPAKFPSGSKAYRTPSLSPKWGSVCDPDRHLPGSFPLAPDGVSVDDNMALANAHAGKLRWFYNQVRNRGPWDYKQRGPEYQNFGNYNFGAAGTAAGISSKMLLQMAGWAQRKAGTSRPEWNPPGGGPPYGDDPNDQFQIRRGINHARGQGYMPPETVHPGNL